VIVGGYELHLYCAREGCEAEADRESSRATGGLAGSFAGSNEREAVAAAMARGWIFCRGEAWCSRKCLNPKSRKASPSPSS
jgi:hypothetical protein